MPLDSLIRQPFAMASVDESARALTAASPSRLAKLLLDRGLVTSEQLAAATRDQRKHGGQLAAALVRVGALSEEDLTATLRQTYRLPVIDPSTHAPAPEVLALIPHALARKHDVLPVSLVGSTLTIAMVDPANHAALAEVKFATGCDLRIVLAAPRGIQRAIDRFYNQSAERYRDALDLAAAGRDTTIDRIDLAELERATENRPLVKLVSALLIDAVERRASDIHIEPFETDLRIRFRIDGVLYDIMRPPTHFKNALTSRIKIMAALDIAERRLPQDGAIKLRLPTGKDASFRVSSLPTIYGEKLVLRLLDEASLKLDMSHLGLESGQLRDFDKAITRPHGLVLITGPTGSGKSTTLYALLAEINDSVTNISTAEDPVELSLDGVNQVQINEEIGLTFAAALRAFLRQDPDVIMIGEIRDHETAEIAVKAALTGHLVLSTLHTNDAPSTVNRLLDMGCQPFLVSSSLVLIAAQRLVRLICRHCKIEARALSGEALAEVGFTTEEITGLTSYRGAGCGECSGTGYRGRVALYEVLPIDDRLREMMLGRAPAPSLRNYAVARGMQTLRESGLNKIRSGLTTIEEVLRVTER